jgi:cullin 4
MIFLSTSEDSYFKKNLIFIKKKNTKEFQVSLYQTLVLLLFNNSDSINYEEIKDTTKIDDTELKRILQSLACGKVPILIKNTKV